MATPAGLRHQRLARPPARRTVAVFTIRPTLPKKIENCTGSVKFMSIVPAALADGFGSAMPLPDRR
jgi:hypothetical protein